MSDLNSAAGAPGADPIECSAGLSAGVIKAEDAVSGDGFSREKTGGKLIAELEGAPVLGASDEKREDLRRAVHEAMKTARVTSFKVMLIEGVLLPDGAEQVMLPDPYYGEALDAPVVIANGRALKDTNGLWIRTRRAKS